MITGDSIIFNGREPYPVGSIFMSVSSTNPSAWFGGTWAQLENRFLLAADSTYALGDTGGEATHTLTVDEMPSHQHQHRGYHGISGGSTAHTIQGMTSGSASSAKYNTTGPACNTSGTNAGGAAHENMPPYLVVYMWKRTA